VKSVVVTANGLDLSVGISQGGGIPILFVHGFSHDRHVWQDVATPLPAGFRPLTVDLRGHGDSDWSLDAAYRPSDYASDLGPVLDACAVDRAVVVGHSLGGNVATLFAADQPDRVSALVLVDTGPSLSGAAWDAAAGDAALAMGCFPDVESYRRVLNLAYPFGRPEALERLARTGLVRRVDGRFEPKMDPLLVELTGTESQWADNESALWAALGKLQCPTLVVRGERSAMLSPEIVREMVDNVLDRGCHVSVRDAGHAVAVDNPGGLVEAITGFLEQQALTGRASVAGRYGPDLCEVGPILP
jgi:pimeloyl-ACP methyl ester carboxylesterase